MKTTDIDAHNTSKGDLKAEAGAVANSQSSTKGLAVKGITMKTKCLALAMIATALTSFGIAWMQIEAGPTQPVIEKSNQPPMKGEAKKETPPKQARVDELGDPLPEQALFELARIDCSTAAFGHWRFPKMVDSWLRVPTTGS